MIILTLVSFIGIISGTFILLDLTVLDFATGFVSDVEKYKRKKTLKQMISDVVNPKELKGIKKTVKETQEVLRLMGQSHKFISVCIISVFMMFLGMFIAISLSNFFMLPVLTVGMGVLPFWYLNFISHSYKKQINAELETALSIITTSYLRNESIITSVEENVEYLNPPVREVFQSFLTESDLINVNTKQALKSMKNKISSDIFKEWVDGMVACQDDKTLKTTLPPIINKLSDMRIVSAELDYLMYEPLKEYITMALLLVGNVPIIYLLNKEWYNVLVNTGFGKSILAICTFFLLFSFGAVLRITKPVEYKR